MFREGLAWSRQIASATAGNAPTWVRQLETVFGEDHQRLADDFADFLVEIPRRDNARAQAEEAG